MKIAPIYLVTTHGKQLLKTDPSDRLIDCLMKNQIPWTAVSSYLYDTKKNLHTLWTGLDEKIESITSDQEIHLIYQRNIDPSMFQINSISVDKTQSTESVASEYFYRDPINGHKSPLILKRYSDEECKSIVAKCVSETIRKYVPENASIIVGVSGGGDSNALLDALSKFNEYKIIIHPVIIKGVGEWDAGVPRALELCDKYNISLKIIEEIEIRKLLNVPEQGASISERFSSGFENDDFEFLGTLIIRLALAQEAERLGTSYICTGLNFEDLLAGALYRISNNAIPLTAPCRVIGRNTYLYPMWQVPKKIVDGCFPKYSLENYSSRYPCFSEGRTMFYQMAYSISAQFPQMGERMLRGLSEIGQHHDQEIIFDERLGFETLGQVPLPLKEKFIKVLRG
jgi:tRNA(Ile)-lysidine synthase TilS/MesJ